MRIYVPSMSRFSPNELSAGVLSRIPVSMHPRVAYVVPADQTASYATGMSKVGYKPVIVPTEEKGIALVRKFIGIHASKHQSENFVMLDDDIDFLMRKSADNWQLRAVEHAEVPKMMEHVEQLLKTHACVGTSAREGNNRAGVGSPAQLVAMNTRILRFLAFRTKEFNKCAHGRVEVMEDFDVQLQLLRAGFNTACSFYYANGQKMTSAPGGCSTYRTHSVQDASARKLSTLHPSFVNLRQKENKTDAAGFGTRTEVTIYWKKAAMAGKTDPLPLGTPA